MKTVLITGANKGIGLEMVKQHVNRGDKVIAVCRTPSKALQATDAAVVSNVDFLSEDFEKTLLNQIEQISSIPHIDKVIANAGIRDFDNYQDFDVKAIRNQFEVNTIAPLRLIKALDALLTEKTRIILISTRVASHEDNTGGGEYGYRMSKSALNMAGINLSISLRHRGIAVFMLHPGYVRTDLTLGEGLIDANLSAQNIIELSDHLTLNESGSFWHAIERIQLPW